MSQRKLLVIDTETGGLSPLINTILSLAAIVVNDGAIEDEYYTLINDGAAFDAITEKEALAVNGLTREKIETEGVSQLAAIHGLTALLERHDMRYDVRIAAHGAAFDVGFLQRLYRRAGQDFSKRFSRRSLCTQTGALLLEQAGRIDLPGGSASLDTLVKLWNIPLDREVGHNALNDAHATVAVLNRQLKLIGGR